MKAQKKNQKNQTYEVSINLIDYNRFKLVFSYNKKLVETIKTIPGRQYNPKIQRWSLPLSKYSEMIKKISEMGTDIKIVKPLTEKELSSAQIIIINEDDNNFFIQYPKNDEIKSILKNFGASWIESEYCWRLNNLIKEEIMARFQLLNIIVKKLSDKEKCKF